LFVAFPIPPPLDENFRNAFCRNEGFFGEDAVDVLKAFGDSPMTASLSLGENEAPNGLMSGLTGGLNFGATWGAAPCPGGVVPVENLELIDEIHEFRLPGTAFGALPLTGVTGGFAALFSGALRASDGDCSVEVPLAFC
jgi:hypothetical protein